MLKNIKWFYEKGNILEASTWLENAESKSTGFLTRQRLQHAQHSGLRDRVQPNIWPPNPVSFWSRAASVCCNHLGPLILSVSQRDVGCEQHLNLLA